MRSATLLALLVAGATLAETPRGYSLVGDRKSRRVDDVVTVMVVEDNAAQNNAQTRTQSDQKASLAMEGSILPAVGAGAAAQNRFDGQGRTSRAGMVSAVVSARVVQVLSNGNLLVEGSKQVVINEETEILTVSGMVRPEDIAADNTVPSTRLADAKISYSGRGVDSNASRPGWFSRFLDWLF